MLSSNLFQILVDKFGCELIQEGDDRNLTHFTFLTEETVLCDDACLYVGSLHEAETTACSFALLTTELCPPCQKNAAIVYVPPEKFSACMNKMTALFFEEQKWENEFSELMPLTPEKISLHDMINRAAEFLDRSLILTDLSFRVVSYSSSRPVTDRIWKLNIARGYCSYEFISAINELLPAQTLPDTPEPFFVNCAASFENKLCSLLFHKERTIGYLILLDNQKGILPYHMKYLPKLSQMMTQSLTSFSDSAELFLSTRETMLLDMLEKRTPGDENSMITAANLSLPEQMQCVTFFPKNSSSHDLFYLQRNLRYLFPLEAILVYKTHVIALLSLKSMEYLKESGICADFMKHVKEVGVSLAFQNLREFAVQTDYALKACEIANIIESRDYLCYYEKYQFFHILLSCKEESLLRAYMHPALEKLHSQDLIQDAQLLETLQTYIKNGRNGKKTAELLYLHRNTLNYRLNKIKELTNLDLEDTEEIFRLSCSFYINQLFHIF